MDIIYIYLKYIFLNILLCKMYLNIINVIIIYINIKNILLLFLLIKFFK